MSIEALLMDSRNLLHLSGLATQPIETGYHAGKRAVEVLQLSNHGAIATPTSEYHAASSSKASDYRARCRNEDGENFGGSHLFLSRKSHPSSRMKVRPSNCFMSIHPRAGPSAPRYTTCT